MKKIPYLINKVVSTFKGHPLLHLKHIFTEKVLPPLMKRIKVKYMW